MDVSGGSMEGDGGGVGGSSVDSTCQWGPVSSSTKEPIKCPD